MSSIKSLLAECTTRPSTRPSSVVIVPPKPPSTASHPFRQVHVAGFAVESQDKVALTAVLGRTHASGLVGLFGGLVSRADGRQASLSVLVEPRRVRLHGGQLARAFGCRRRVIRLSSASFAAVAAVVGHVVAAVPRPGPVTVRATVVLVVRPRRPALGTSRSRRSPVRPTMLGTGRPRRRSFAGPAIRSRPLVARRTPWRLRIASFSPAVVPAAMALFGW